MLRRNPGFAIVALATMALGIGAATTLFSVTYGVLMRPLPWTRADRLVRITETRKGHEPRVRGTMSNGPYHTWAADHSTIDALGGWLNISPTASIAGGEPMRLPAAAVTPSLFTAVLQARPLLGRVFVDDDARITPGNPSAIDAIVLSYGLWQERFGGSADAVGRTMQIDGRTVTVVGVMPRDFAFPTRDTRAWTPWIPATVLGGGAIRMTIFSALARLRDGATPAQAAAEATARAKSAPDPGMTAVAMFGGNGPAELQAMPAIAQMTADVRPALLVLLAAVALLLLTATANVASLQLARAAARRREIAIRAAIGASGPRLTRQLVMESATIGAGGGLAGIALAIALHRILPSLLPADFPRVDAVEIDWRVLLFAAAATMVTSVACGLLPARHSRRVNLVESLAEDGASPAGGSGRTAVARARTAIMACQVAVSCVLLVGAALLTRSFIALLHADRGYDATNVLTASVAFPSGYSMERRLTVLEKTTERLRGLPGVKEAAFANALPFLTAGGFRGFRMRPPANPSVEIDVSAMQRVVGPGYDAALGLRLVEGRALTAADTMNAPQVILVDRAFATRYLGGRAIGAEVPNLGMCRDRDRWQVVGVVDDVRQGAAVDERQPEVFLPARQVGCTGSLSQGIIVVRTAGDPGTIVQPLRSAVRDADPSLAVDSVMTLDDRVMRALAKPRLYAVVLVGFAVFAVTIAAVGLFGIVAYTVGQRAREIGVRTALGARPADIVRLVLRQAAVVVLAGTAVGLWIAFASARALTTFLYGVAPDDPVTFAAVVAALWLVSAVACVLPALRAARIDPLRALRTG